MFVGARVPSYAPSPAMPACSDPTDTVSLALIQVARSSILTACTVSHNSMTHCSAVVIFFLLSPLKWRHTQCVFIPKRAYWCFVKPTGDSIERCTTSFGYKNKIKKIASIVVQVLYTACTKNCGKYSRRFPHDSTRIIERLSSLLLRPSYLIRLIYAGYIWHNFVHHHVITNNIFQLNMWTITTNTWSPFEYSGLWRCQTFKLSTETQENTH